MVSGKVAESSIVMPEDHMEELYTSPNPLVRFVHVQRLKKIVEIIPASGKRFILDAGCGEGHLLRFIHDSAPIHALFGVDATGIAIAKASVRCPFAQLVQGDLSRLPFGEETFDIITCTEVLEHIPEYDATIKELVRVLKPGGLLMITFPNEGLWILSRFLLGRKPIKVPDHVNSFTPGMMRKIVPLSCISRQNLPFGLPFLLSLNGWMMFKKKE